MDREAEGITARCSAGDRSLDVAESNAREAFMLIMVSRFRFLLRIPGRSMMAALAFFASEREPRPHVAAVVILLLNSYSQLVVTSADLSCLSLRVSCFRSMNWFDLQIECKYMANIDLPENIHYT